MSVQMVFMVYKSPYFLETVLIPPLSSDTPQSPRAADIPTSATNNHSTTDNQISKPVALPVNRSAVSSPAAAPVSSAGQPYGPAVILSVTPTHPQPPSVAVVAR